MAGEFDREADFERSSRVAEKLRNIIHFAHQTPQPDTRRSWSLTG
jgi:hypothetical protein